MTARAEAKQLIAEHQHRNESLHRHPNGGETCSYCDLVGHYALVVLLRHPELLARLAAEAAPDEPHVVSFHEDGWTMQHPLACRISGDLFRCPHNLAAAGQLEGPPPAGLGVYRAALDDQGRLTFTPHDQEVPCPPST